MKQEIKYLALLIVPITVLFFITVVFHSDKLNENKQYQHQRINNKYARKIAQEQEGDSMKHMYHSIEDEKNRHWLLLDNIRDDACIGDNTPDSQILDIIDENEDYTFDVDLKDANDVTLFQLCYAKHAHAHTIKLKLKHDSNDRSKGDCDLYISASDTNPGPIDRWDWKSAARCDESINIPTYSEELVKASDGFGMIIAVRNKEKAQKSKCKLHVEISTLASEKLLGQLGLRGGQVLLPHQVKGFHKSEG